MTEYIILERTNTEPDVWQEFPGTVKASSAKRALAAGNGSEVSGGVFVAVPARSWRPLLVKIEQTTKVTIG